MGLDVGQETVSGWTMKSNFDTAVDKVGWGVIGDGARLGAGWARGATGARIASSRCSRATTRCARAVPRARDAPNARVPTRREGQKKPQVFGGLVGQMRTFQPWTVTPWPIMEDALADCELGSGRRGQ